MSPQQMNFVRLGTDWGKNQADQLTIVRIETLSFIDYETIDRYQQ
jgi:hypothetical protein